jgi:hypothetical protein
MTDPKPSFFTRLGRAWSYLFGGEELVAPVVPALPAPAPVVVAAPPPPPPEKAWASGLYLLAILQREGRFIDFLMEDVTAFSDADVGAAARVVHQGCRKVLVSSVDPVPAHEGSEGANVTVPAGFDANRYRLVGNVTGAGPYTGSLKHHGWVAKSVALPELPTAMDPKVLAPAEVELP